MYIELSTNQAADMLIKAEVFGDSYAACLAMVEYLEQIEDCNPHDHMELDPIAIRCEFSLDTLNNYAESYSDALNNDGITVTKRGFYDDKDAVIEWFSDRTIFIHVEKDLYIKGEC